MNMLSFLLPLALIPLTLPAFSLLALTVGAVLKRASTIQEDHPRTTGPAPRVAVLVPAHNESRNVLPTIDCLRGQLAPEDRLIVIADNCTDDTAALARDAGAEVIERHNHELKGKGYALAFGVNHLRQDPPDVVVVVDADCVLSSDAVSQIADKCYSSKRPLQMLYVMHAGKKASLKLRVVEFAMTVKNLVRPLGGQRLGGVCHLMGTGMALPWALASTAKLATGHIAEDMKLGIDLAIAGHPTEFLAECRVSSRFHADDTVTKVQKSRWEHGHLDAMKEELPKLFKQLIKTRKLALLVLAMDLMIPPLAFYCALLASTSLLTGTLALLWPVWQGAAWLSISACLALALAITFSWFHFGRHLLSAKELLTTPVYVLWKLPVYLAYFLKKKSGWVRTKRESE